MIILEAAKKLMVIMSWGRLWQLPGKKVPMEIKLVLDVDYRDIFKENFLKIEGLQVRNYVLAVAKDTIGVMSTDLNKMQKAGLSIFRETGKRACSGVLKPECTEL